ncbi:dihydrofolate reductase family protein [Amycolatopsis sp. NPDC058340]|uniref:dihydrofolate reductase family protein n=1 Tax=Amycolatopsis sp. NPDC058340 TaxID=3346453 RepID=UPI003659710C
MGKTIVDISPSLDGYVAGEGVGVDAPFGTAGQRLTAWSMEDPDDADKAAARVMFENTGAFVIGRTLFDVGIGLWGEDGTWGMPVYVVTHRPGPDLVKGPTRFSFVDGVEEALRRAKETAAGRDVVIAGGASVVQQALAGGQVDELRLHIVPELVGGGTRLFEGADPASLVQVSAAAGRHAVHVTYRVEGRG